MSNDQPTNEQMIAINTRQVEHLRRSLRTHAEQRVRDAYLPQNVALAMLVTATEVLMKELPKNVVLEVLRDFANDIENGDLQFMLKPSTRAN